MEPYLIKNQRTAKVYVKREVINDLKKQNLRNGRSR
jgi:hypothetical protein